MKVFFLSRRYVKLFDVQPSVQLIEGFFKYCLRALPSFLLPFLLTPICLESEQRCCSVCAARSPPQWQNTKDLTLENFLEKE